MRAKARFIEIRKRDGITPICYLTPESDNITSAVVNTTLESESTLEFTMPVENEKIQYITHDCKIYADNDREYILNTSENAITIERDKDGKRFYKVSANESQSKLNTITVQCTNYIEFGEVLPTDSILLDEFIRRFPLNVLLLQNATLPDDETKEFRVPSNNPYPVGSIGHNIYALLYYADWGNKNDKWTLRNNETYLADSEGYLLQDSDEYFLRPSDSDIGFDVDEFPVVEFDKQKSYTIETEDMMLLDNLKKVAEIYGAILIFDSITHTISVKNPNTWFDYNGYQVRYGKNLISLQRKMNNRVINKAWIFGNNRQGIKDINPTKQGYLLASDLFYTELEKEFYAVESTDIFTNADIFVDFTTNETKTETQNMLMAWGKEQLRLACRPRYTYTANAVDLRQLAEFSHEEFSVGDMCEVIDETLDIGTLDKKEEVINNEDYQFKNRILLRIMRHRYDVFQPQNSELEIGTLKNSLVYQLAELRKRNSELANKFTSAGRLSRESE